jgi:hypothetical protein
MNKSSDSKRISKINKVEAVLVGIVVLAAFMALFVRLPVFNSYFTYEIETDPIPLSSDS